MGALAHGPPQAHAHALPLWVSHACISPDRQVFIVANALTHGAMTAWAVGYGLPAANVLNTGRADGACNVASDVAFAIQAAGLDDSHLVRGPRKGRGVSHGGLGAVEVLLTISGSQGG